MVQNTKSLEILSGGIDAVVCPFPPLPGECLDDLFNEYSKLVETVRNLKLQG